MTGDGRGSARVTRGGHCGLQTEEAWPLGDAEGLEDGSLAGARFGPLADFAGRPDEAPQVQLVEFPVEGACGSSDPVSLVGASFAFLLQRETKESILREFDLTVVARYFPDYEREIGHRLAR